MKAKDVDLTAKSVIKGDSLSYHDRFFLRAIERKVTAMPYHLREMYSEGLDDLDRINRRFYRPKEYRRGLINTGKGSYLITLFLKEELFYDVEHHCDKCGAVLTHGCTLCDSCSLSLETSRVANRLFSKN